MAQAGLLRREYLGICHVAPDAASAIAHIDSPEAPATAVTDKW